MNEQTIKLSIGQRWHEIRETTSYTGHMPRKINRHREIIAVEGDRVTFRISTSRSERSVTKSAFRAWVRLYKCTLEDTAQ